VLLDLARTRLDQPRDLVVEVLGRHVEVDAIFTRRRVVDLLEGQSIRGRSEGDDVEPAVVLLDDRSVDL
jgi:hypothetical protein